MNKMSVMKAIAAGLLSLFLGQLSAKEPVDYIDPIIGTSSEKKDSGHGLGRTFPGPVAPFGLVQLSPDTIMEGNNTAGYSHHHESIDGFSFTHMSGVGAKGDLGNILVTPTTGPLKTDIANAKTGELGFASKFSHSTEVTQAGYYAVTLDTYKVRSELTALKRTGMLRFTYPKDAGKGRVQIDLARKVGGSSIEQFIKVIDENTIEGWVKCIHNQGGGFTKKNGPNYTIYFHGKFNRPLKDFGIWSADISEKFKSRNQYGRNGKAYREAVRNAEVFKGKKEMQGKHLGFYAEYPVNAVNQINLKMGISFVSTEGAKRNLETEMPSFDFEAYRKQARDDWAEAVNGIKIEGASDKEKTIFYTSMYHLLNDPRTFSDVDGRYVGADGKIHQNSNFVYRTVFSGWDVFRSKYPLLTILRPDVVNDKINSFIQMGELSGTKQLPRWELLNKYTRCMLGEPAVSVIADAYTKGIRNYDLDKAYEFSKNTMLDYEEYENLGYSPEKMSVSVTLEIAYADWCLAQMAQDMGKDVDYKRFLSRSMNYKNIYDPSVKSMRSKGRDGSFKKFVSKTEFRGSGCIESNTFQQGWFVPHDVQGLINLMGKDVYMEELNTFFDKTPKDFGWSEYYNHPNEPVHQVPYMFTYAGAPWLTQKWTRKIVDNAYGVGVHGIHGNDDVGQMSAWYVLSAMGFHPVAPGDQTYIIGSPRFGKVSIRLDQNYYKGKTFTVTAKNNNDENIYIQSAKLNGKPLNRAWISHKEIVDGGILEFVMGNQPNKVWGSLKKDLPPSASK